jgi:RNA polymerase sigma-70 factor (ECF subfamily)
MRVQVYEHDRAVPELSVEAPAVEALADEAIARRIRYGCAAAESEFCRRYVNKTLRFVRGQARSVMHAEDITQETMVIVLKSLRAGKVENPARLSGYVRQTARNLLLIDFRTLYKREVPIDTVEPRHDSTGDNGALDEIIQSETERLLHTRLHELRMTRDREILIQHYVLEIDKPRICENMEIDNEHFDRVVSRARKRARKLLATDKDALLTA